MYIYVYVYGKKGEREREAEDGEEDNRERSFLNPRVTNDRRKRILSLEDGRRRRCRFCCCYLAL